MKNFSSDRNRLLSTSLAASEKIQRPYLRSWPWSDHQRNSPRSCIRFAMFFCVLMLCSAAFTSCASNDQTTGVPQATPTTGLPTVQPGIGKTPTSVVIQPTPTPHPPSIPRLGGDISAFMMKYGKPNAHSSMNDGLYDFQQYPNSPTDFLIVTADLGDGGPYTNHAEVITVQAPPDNGWSQSEAKDICTAFFPPDAVYQQQVTVIGGYDKIYFSASLASAFPATAFQDANQNQIKAGTFDVLYLVHSDSTISTCSLSPGTAGTK